MHVCPEASSITVNGVYSLESMDWIEALGHNPTQFSGARGATSIGHALHAVMGRK